MKPLRNLFLPRSAVRLPYLVSCNLARKKCTLFVKNLAATMVVFALAPSSVFAANQTWDGGSTANGTWSTAANWIGDPTAPGDPFRKEGAQFHPLFELTLPKEHWRDSNEENELGSEED